MRVQEIELRLLRRNDGQIEGLPKNPRFIRDEKFELLKKSIQENPEMLGLRELLVYPIGERYVIIGGNMRYEACKALGYQSVPCKVLDADTPVETLKAYIIKDNAGFGEWDWDAIANEWDTDEVADWGLDVPEWDIKEDDDAADIERKRKEFEDRMANGENLEEDEEYQKFLEKFELKKTTDDCYTPPLVYDALADWVANEYHLNKRDFVRPFYPGGDYQNETYTPGCVVVDNPPFSIMSEILNFYNGRGIRYFLFAPHLTMFNASSSSSSSSIVVGVSITYENGASVNTSFITNLEPTTVRIRTAPTLYAAVKSANDVNLKQARRELPRYSYDLHVVTSAMLSPYSRLGIDFIITKQESERIAKLDAQKSTGVRIYGGGYLISDRLFAEREKAEREKEEREKAEREKAERWELSERELEIIRKLSKNN